MLWGRNSTGAEGDLLSVPWCWSLKLGGLKRLGASQMVGLESSGGFSHHMSSICNGDDPKPVLSYDREPQHRQLASPGALGFSRPVAAF